MGSGKPRPARRLGDALRALAAALDALPVPGMIIGGIAVIAHGVPRTTRDIDATIAQDPASLGLTLDLMARHGIEPRISDAAAFARESAVLLLKHTATGVEIDLVLAALPFELEALATAAAGELVGVHLRIARPEDLVIYKVAAWRPQDQQDVERLLVLHGDRMDLVRVRTRVVEICAALDQPERVADLDRLLDLVRR